MAQPLLLLGPPSGSGGTICLPPSAALLLLHAHRPHACSPLAWPGLLSFPPVRLSFKLQLKTHLSRSLPGSTGPQHFAYHTPLSLSASSCPAGTHLCYLIT